MSAPATPPEVVTLTLNPALDRTLTIREFAAGAVNRVERVTEKPGGKGINVAAALADYGHRVAALGFLGRENEEPFAAFFAAKGIEDRCLRLPGATRVGIKIADPIRRQTTDINFPGLAPTADDLAALRTRVARIEARWCVVAGSLPPGVGGEVYGEIIAALKTRGVRVVLDTSGEALRQALTSAPAIIKPNAQELGGLVGRALATEAEVIAAAQGLVASGIGLVAVSRGADGACFVTADEVVVARPPEITVHSTVGAGDAIVAGIVAAQLEGRGLAAIARLATAFAVHALTGGAGGPGGRAQIEALERRVQLIGPLRRA